MTRQPTKRPDDAIANLDRFAKMFVDPPIHRWDVESVLKYITAPESQLQSRSLPVISVGAQMMDESDIKAGGIVRSKVLAHIKNCKNCGGNIDYPAIKYDRSTNEPIYTFCPLCGEFISDIERSTERRSKPRGGQ